MPYIKTYSNYVIKKEHQLTNDGKIYERDITTIGGLDKFSKGQVPIYRSGNFIITINNEPSVVKDYSNDTWESWSLKDINPNSDNKNEIEILSNQEYYDLSDFAYYGSCAELIRGSLTDIIDRFPGELYAPELTTSYDDNGNPNERTGIIVTDSNGDQYIKENGWYLLDNPFGVNIHTKYINPKDIANPLKYFCNDGVQNYEFHSGSTVTSVDWSIDRTYECDGKNKLVRIADVKINGIDIIAIRDENGEIVYLTKTLNWSVRPKQTIQDNFFKSLDSFQKILLNRESKPKYSVLFQIIRENKFGYYTEMKKFTFPTTYGGYNLAVNDSAYSEYLNKLVDVSVLYDEYFSDNLYRAMTHEAIKNFDWSYTREYPNGNEGEYFIAGTRIQKTLRLFGREFDEIKRYIDGIGNSCVLSYNNNNNMPNFLLSDSLENDGWDVISIIPSDLGDSDTIKPYDSDNNAYENGYFLYTTYVNGSPNTIKEAAESNKQYKVVDGVLRTKIQQYFSDKEYTMQDVENHFMKVLRLNSRYIWRHKGTIEGIEMLLALFGLKSNRFASGGTYDYEIKEYVYESNYIVDGGNSIDNFNKTKTFAYNTDDYRNGVYNKYQGLPVKCYNGNVLVPFFDKDMIIDGNPYYQMKGGWMHNNGHYTETIKDVRSVENLKELLSIPYKDLINGSIYYVNDTSSRFITIDGVVYDLQKDVDNSDYFVTTVFNHNLKVGGNLLLDEIMVSSSNGGNQIYDLNDLEDGHEIKIYLNDGKCFAHETFLQDDSPILNSKIFSVPQSREANNNGNYFKIKDKNYKTEFSSNGWRNLTTSELNALKSTENYFNGNNPHFGNNSYDGGEEYLDYFRHLFKHAIEKKAFDKRCYVGTTMDDIIGMVKKDIGFTLTKTESNKIAEKGSSYSEQIINTKKIKISFNISNNGDIYKKEYINNVVLKYLSEMIPSTAIVEIV